MRAVFGLLLIMFGLAMAVVWMPENDGERQLAAVTEIATQGLAGRSSQPRADDRGGQNILAAYTAACHRRAEPLEATRRSAKWHRGAQHHADDAGRGAAGGDARNVHCSRRRAPIVRGYDKLGKRGDRHVQGCAVCFQSNCRRPVRTGISVGRDQRTGQAEAMPREELVRNLQREFKRVGCYHGDVDGSWGVGSKRAMGAFTDRVNASLPVEQPDFILLTLLQGQSGAICGKDVSGRAVIVRRPVPAERGRGARRQSATRRSSSRRRHRAGGRPSIQREAAAPHAGWIRSQRDAGQLPVDGRCARGWSCNYGSAAARAHGDGGPAGRLRRIRCSAAGAFAGK